jgi:hypothetical protein
MKKNRDADGSRFFYYQITKRIAEQMRFAW